MCAQKRNTTHSDQEVSVNVVIHSARREMEAMASLRRTEVRRQSRKAPGCWESQGRPIREYFSDCARTCRWLAMPCKQHSISTSRRFG